MDVREKLALSVCDATQKTNFKCEFNCENKGKCAYCLVMAEQLIAHGVTVQEWISVKDRLPDKDGNYLTYDPRYGDIEIYYYMGCGEWDHHRNGITDAESHGFAHWMPLPTAPEDLK